MGLATRSSHREMTMGNLERYFQTILEIERALARIEAGQYDICVACREPIPDKRLQALPWTRTCVQCARGRSQFIPSTLGLNLKHV
jgi:DnaK suppressor protein